jgi:hypothetical protein
MGGALQNDVKTTHQLKYTYITFTIGFDRGILQVMSEISTNMSSDLQRCLKLNSSWVDGGGTGGNVVFR